MAGCGWNRQLDLVFERALVLIDEDTPGRWEKIAAVVGKSVEEVKRRYEDLVIDIVKIQAGLFPVPKYEDDYSSDESDDVADDNWEQSKNEEPGKSSVHDEEASSSYGKTKKT